VEEKPAFLGMTWVGRSISHVIPSRAYRRTDQHHRHRHLLEDMKGVFCYNGGEVKQITINAIFQEAQDVAASDIHLVTGQPPLMRLDGVITRIEGYDQELTSEEIKAIVVSTLTQTQRDRFEREREIDLSYQIPSGTRFRVNCHFERDNMGLVARVIPEKIPTMEDIHLPDIMKELTTAYQGIVLFTGPTGCGKSTSLAAMMEDINLNRPVHIVTLEDPIEFLYHPKKAIIRQRQFGTDFLSFEEALKRILRQDPNVILVGEMRDLETIAAALTLAETGHLVFGTLHTNNAAQTIDRIIDVFPPYQQGQIRTQLSMTLNAVVSQRLAPRKGGGRIAIREVMLNTPAVGNIIRDNRIAELPNVIQTAAEEGMITVERDVARITQLGLLEKEVAAEFVRDPRVLKTVKVKKGLFG
jgi:twitching motility protein PilT